AISGDVAQSNSARAAALRSSADSYMPSAGSRSDGAFSWYSEITPAGGPVSSRRAILARQVSARPNSTTAETVRRPRNSMFSARTCHIEPRGETVSGTTTRMSEFFRVELLPDLTDLRLAGFEVLRGVAELHDRPERRDALLVVVLRFLQRVLPLVAGEQ